LVKKQYQAANHKGTDHRGPPTLFSLVSLALWGCATRTDLPTCRKGGEKKLLTKNSEVEVLSRGLGPSHQKQPTITCTKEGNNPTYRPGIKKGCHRHCKAKALENAGGEFQEGLNGGESGKKTRLGGGFKLIFSHSEKRTCLFA